MLLDRIIFAKLQENISYCDYDTKTVCIDYLLLKSVLRDFYDIKAKVGYDNLDLYTLIECIEQAINNCNFTSKQRERLILYMQGYSEIEISKLLGVSAVTIHKSLISSTKKISSELERIINYEFRSS